MTSTKENKTTTSSQEEEQQVDQVPKTNKVQKPTAKKMNMRSYGEQLLRAQDLIYAKVAREEELNEMIIYFAKVGGIFASLYGFCVGTFAGPLQMISSAIKTPVLFFLPLLICSPSLFTFNILLGTQMTYKQIVVLLLAMTYMSAVVLSSFAPIMLFFILTGGSYKFTLLLNVAICGVAGITGVLFLFAGLSYVNRSLNQTTNMQIRYVWFILYMFVGTQLAWGMRPFVGGGNEFAWYRSVNGNVYASLFHLAFDR